MSGATRRQALSHVCLPMALPAMPVGANPLLMFALFLMMIAAFIGTQDVGTEMQRAFSSTVVGKASVLGFAVAFMGLMTDHRVMGWSRDRKCALGT